MFKQKTGKAGTWPGKVPNTFGLALLVLFVLCVPLLGDIGRSSAATSSYLNFQARLLNNGGAIVPDGTYNVEFKIYDSLAAGGSAQGTCVGGGTDDCLWVETRTAANKVTVKSGYLSVYLGQVTALPNINWDQDLYLTMNIGGTAVGPTWDGEMTPRLKLTAVPYAMSAGQLAKFNGTQTGTLSFNTVANSPDIKLPDITGTNNVLLQSGTTLFTPGSIPFTSSTTGLLTQDNANFFFDDANDTLGIGGTRVGAISATNARVVIQGSGTGNTTSVLNVTDSGGGSKLFVRDDGYIGVGTNDPQSAFHFVRSDVGGPLTLKVQNTGGSGVDARLLLSTSVTASNTSVGVIVLADRTDAGSAGDTDLLFQNSAGTAMNTNLIIKASGNVGIGDTDPTSLLTVGSGDRFQVDVNGNTSLDNQADLRLYEADGNGSNYVAIQALSAIGSNVTLTWSALGQCTGSNGGSLTINGSSEIICSDDDGGAGGGTVSSSGGTPDRIAKFTAAQSIGDSSISDNGTTVTVLGTTNLLIQGGTTTIGTSTALGNLVLHDGNGQTITLKAGDSAGNLAFFFPTADGGNNDCLKTNGSGQLVFGNCNNGSGSGGAVTLQDAYDSSGTPATISLATGKNLAIISPDVAVDPNIVFDLQCTTCSANGGRFIVQSGSTDVLSVSPNGGETLIRTATNSSSGFRIQSSGGAQTVLSANTVVRAAGTAGNLIKIGDSTGTDLDTTILQVDTATADPTTNLGSLNGGIFYNSTSGKLNIVEGGAVKTLCNTTDLNCAVSTGAPVGAAYLTIGNNATLTNERAISDGTNISISDAGANSTYTISTRNDPSFSGLVTASNTAATALAVTGAPANSATSSLIQFGSAISGGNSSANGGTYLGLNAPSSGAGSVADFVNFQTGGTYKLKVTSTGLVDSAVGFAVAGSSGGSVTCSSGQVLSDSVVSGGILTTTGTCITPTGTGANTALSNLSTTSVNQDLIASSNNARDLGASGTTWRSGYFGTSLISPSLDSAASTSLSVGGTNATAISIGQTGVTTTIAGSTSLGAVTAGTWNGTAIGIGYGGTGANTAQGAINAISGLTTNGDLMYHNGTNTTRLPRGANGQCLTSNNTTITWGSCGAGGGGSLQGAYDTSSTTDPQIQLSATNGGIKIRDGSTPVTGNLLQLQNNAGTATYLGISATTFTLQDSSGNNALIFDSTTSELKVYGNTTSPTNYARLYYDDAASEAVFAASTGTTRVGNGNGDVTITLTAAADTLLFDHTFSAGAGYSGTDFYVVRSITGSSHAITGNIMTVEDLTTFTSGSSAPNVLYVNQNNTGATGNLILAQTGGGANDKFKVTTAGTVIIAAGQSYTGAGAVSVSSAASTALTLTSNAAATWSTSSGNLTIQAGGANTVILKPGTNSATAVQVQNAAGTSMLSFDSSANRINVGVSDTTGTLLVLDTKTDAGDPTGTDGAMYYNSNAGRFRCYEAGAWRDCLTSSRFIVKGAAESVNGSAVLQDDNDLSFTMGPNEIWVFNFVLLVSNNNSAGPDWKSAILAAGSASCNVTLSGSEPAGAAFPQVSTTDCTTPATLANATIVADTDAYNVTLQGRVTAGAGGGTVKLQWAQNTSTGVNLDVRGGSYVIAQKVGGN